MQGTCAVELSGIHKFYGTVHALRGVDFEVAIVAMVEATKTTAPHVASEASENSSIIGQPWERC